MYYFKGIGILSKNALFTPIFWIIWTVLKINSNHYFRPLFYACHQVQFKKNLTNQNRMNTPAWITCNISWITKPQKRRTDLFQNLCSILKNEKTQKRRTSDWKKWFHYIKWQKHKTKTNYCLQKLAPFYYLKTLSTFQ